MIYSYAGYNLQNVNASHYGEGQRATVVESGDIVVKYRFGCYNVHAGGLKADAGQCSEKNSVKFTAAEFLCCYFFWLYALINAVKCL